MVADTNYVYGYSTNQGLARYPRTGNDPAKWYEMVGPDPEHGWIFLQLRLSRDNSTLFLGIWSSILRFPSDFSREPVSAYQSSSEIIDFALINDNILFAVYFGSGDGELRRCSTNGCNDSSELIDSDFGYASGFVADESEAYWFREREQDRVSPNPSGFVPPSEDLVGTPLDGASNMTSVLIGKSRTSDWHFVADAVMNSHHLYWCDSGRIKMAAR